MPNEQLQEQGIQQQRNYHIKTEEERWGKGNISLLAEDRLGLDYEYVEGSEQERQEIKARNLERFANRSGAFREKYLNEEYLQGKIDKYRTISRDSSRNSATETLNRSNSYKSASTRRGKYKSAKKYMQKAKHIQLEGLEGDARYRKELKKLDHILKAKRYIAEGKALSKEDEKQQKELAEMKIALAKCSLAKQNGNAADEDRFQQLYNSHKEAYNALTASRLNKKNQQTVDRYNSLRIVPSSEEFFNANGETKESMELDDHMKGGEASRMHQIMTAWFVTADGTIDISSENQKDMLTKFKGAFCRTKKNETEEDLHNRVQAKKDYINAYADHIYDVMEKAALDLGYRFLPDKTVDISQGMPEDRPMSIEYYQKNMDALFALNVIGANLSTFHDKVKSMIKKWPDEYGELEATRERLDQYSSLLSVIGSKVHLWNKKTGIDEHFTRAIPLSDAKNLHIHEGIYSTQGMASRMEVEELAKKHQEKAKKA